MKSFKSYVLLGLLSAVFISGCSKSDVPNPLDLNKIKRAKITITVPAGTAGASDYISFAISSATAGGNNTVWKVNNVTRTNEGAIGFGKNEFRTVSTYVIELIEPVPTISSGVQIINYDAPIKFSYVAEINGEVKTNIVNKTLNAGDDFSADYTY